jgi:hypothetical protein
MLRNTTVVIQFFHMMRIALGVFAALLLGLGLGVQSGWAQSTEIVQGEPYIPAIWIDPDGCEHWVMDDGFEGFMTPHVNRDGIPVCHKADVCGVINTDQFFASNRSAIWPAGKRRLTEFFQSATTSNFLVIGHTDNRASDKHSMRLSKKRADAVAKVAKSTGVNVAQIRGYGERQPRTSNETAAGRANNRRVEIVCLR